MSQRFALAPIRETSLNIGSPHGSPHKIKKPSSSSSSYPSSFTPLTPNGLSYAHQQVQLQVDQQQRQGVLVKTQPAKISTPKNSNSSRYNDHQNLTPDSTSTSPPSLQIQCPEPIDKNIAANLAAAKLKLKLQVAIYRLQKKGSFLPKQGKANKSFISTGVNINLQNDCIIASTPKSATIIHPPPPQHQQIKKKPSLSATAYDKNLLLFKTSQKLRLYSIKKESKFYSERRAIPLIPRNAVASQAVVPTVTVAPPQPAADSLNISAATAITTNESTKLNAINTGKSHARQLPPINKILKTPLKSSSRDLVNSFLADGKQYKPFNINTDETIDEDEDGPIKESTSNSIRIGKDILSSSPIQCHTNNNTNSHNNHTNNTHNNNVAFGTPNSFSVAKSLLQLGSGFYN